MLYHRGTSSAVKDRLPARSGGTRHSALSGQHKKFFYLDRKKRSIIFNLSSRLFLFGLTQKGSKKVKTAAASLIELAFEMLNRSRTKNMIVRTILNKIDIWILSGCNQSTR